jgi:periplasmic protein CpxP/Spy
MKTNLNQSHAAGSVRGIFSLLFGLSLLAAVSPAFATESEARPQPAARAAEHMKQMAAELGLTDVQKTQVKTLMQAQRDKLEALRDDESLNRREKMKKMRAMREDTQKQIRALLTPEQQAKFDAMPRPEPGQFRREGAEHPE